MMFGSSAKTTMPPADQALAGRDHRVVTVPETHEVLGTPLEGPWPEGTEVMYLAMGCFWGSERIFWRLPGVVTTAAGYMGGYTPNPTYEESCTGQHGARRDRPRRLRPGADLPELLLKAFWENHDPTQGNRQGNDIGTAYRSAVFWTTPEQESAARATYTAFQGELTEHGYGGITTELASAEDVGPFWYAEDYHQQYLHKNPNGYCNHGPNGLTCPVGVANLPAQQDIAPPAT